MTMKTDRLSQTLCRALNDQITLEAYSAQVYLMLACWADEHMLDGINRFMMKHSQEERVHMAKIIEYVQERGSIVKIEAIKKPSPEPTNILECFEMVLQQEIENTESIYRIVNMSMQEGDWATWNFLQWLVNEQREEEKLALDLLDKAKLAGGIEMTDNARFELNKLIGNTGQEFPVADHVNPLV
ncbi:ferritin [Sphingobacterium sp. SRCM116780]|uniref:ferritin n=1 Tax=Sphingobacterium sp. SRCM116780 TaxID=2907623 RepID=UPI001F1D4FF8|nr:ferritin [Sphingobacterium sp. SRCM116780]UIR56831.1 ferritin [Sphingobacterium sp. SRCM116780]